MARAGRVGDHDTVEVAAHGVQLVFNVFLKPSLLVQRAFGSCLAACVGTPSLRLVRCARIPSLVPRWYRCNSLALRTGPRKLRPFLPAQRRPARSGYHCRDRGLATTNVLCRRWPRRCNCNRAKPDSFGGTQRPADLERPPRLGLPLMTVRLGPPQPGGGDLTHLAALVGRDRVSTGDG